MLVGIGMAYALTVWWPIKCLTISRHNQSMYLYGEAIFAAYVLSYQYISIKETYGENNENDGIYDGRIFRGCRDLRHRGFCGMLYCCRELSVCGGEAMASIGEALIVICVNSSPSASNAWHARKFDGLARRNLRGKWRVPYNYIMRRLQYIKPDAALISTKSSIKWHEAEREM